MDKFNKRRGLLSFLKSNRKKNTKDIGQCPSCSASFLVEDLKENLYVCPSCKDHLYMPTSARLDLVLDKGYKIIEDNIKFQNPLDFPDYEKTIKDKKKETGLKEAITVAHGKIHGQDVLLMVMDKAFIMGSMGSYLGEKLAQGFEYAMKKDLPVIIYSASGGARMQEGIISLMQMAKTSLAVDRHSKEGLLYINIFTDPTTGGVSASFASLGDLTLAEPGALIGFAGPRVIKETIGGDLPEGFQRSEFLMDKGFVDEIVNRQDQKAYLGKVLRIHSKRLR